MRRPLFATPRTQHVLRTLCGLLLIFALALPALAQPQSIGHLISIGDGYADIYAGFIKEAVANVQNGQVNILVLPVAYSTDPTSITDAERATNTQAAETRRLEIETACKSVVNARTTCTTILAPLFTRADATDPSVIKYFLVDLSAVLMVGDNQTIGMQVIAGTPLEEELIKAYQAGVIIAGTGASGGMLSTSMMGGYRENFSAANALDFGAPDLWNTPAKRGLLFGLKDAILDQHFYQRNNAGRLLNAIALPNVPHVGIGVDADTGLNVYDGTRLQTVFGLSTVTIFDAETYHAADAVRYQGPDNTLSLHNVLVQMLAPGRGSYDLTSRTMTVQAQAVPPRAKLDRTFGTLTLPKDAGLLLLAGDLSGDLASNTVIKRFAKLADNPRRHLLIVATGYESDQTAQATAEEYATALNMPSDIVVIPDRAAAQPLVVTQDITGLVLLAHDQSKIKLQSLSLLEAAWRSGLPLLAVDGGAAIAGKFFTAQPPTPTTAAEADIATRTAFVQDTTPISNGLSLLNIMVEPQLLSDNHWGRLFSLAYNHPDLIALGLTGDTALELTTDGVHVIGDNALITLDLRTSQRALGDDDQFVIANGLLDVFAAGDEVKPTTADTQAQPVRVSTPAQPTVTPTRTVTPTPTPTATRRPPTLTPSPTPTLEPTPQPTQVPVDVASTPVFPLALVLGAVILLIVLLAARRPVPPTE